jgi:hypothetical protein
MLSTPWVHVKRIYANSGLRMTELVMWFCTAAAIANHVWAMGKENAIYSVLAVAIVSVVLNSLCTSFGAHMDLASFTTLEDDDDERSPFTPIISAQRASVAEHGGAMLTLVRCLFVHNAAMFLAITSYVVAIVVAGSDEGHEHGPMSRRVLALLSLYVLWYRGWQATFWFNKHNFPHANVMLPRFDSASIQSRHGQEFSQYA